MKRIFCTLVSLFLLLFLSFAVYADIDCGTQGEDNCEFIGTADSFIIGSSSFTFDSASLLGDEGSTEQALFEKMYNGFVNFDEMIDVSELGIKVSNVQFLCDVFGDVLRSDPSLYYVSFEFKYRYNSKNLITKVIPNYLTKDKDEINAVSEQLNDRISEIIGLTNDSMTDIEKLLVIYNEIIMTSNYDNTLAKRTGMEILLNGESVCQGYASAMYAVANRVGIKGSFVRSEEMNHVWNAFLIDGSWYHLDATYGDPFEKHSTNILYSSFLKSEGWMINELEYTGFERIGADSSKYDDYFWNDTTSPVVPIDGIYYYVDNKQCLGRIYTFNPLTGEKKEIYHFTNVWPSTLDRKYRWEGTFSGLAYVNNRIYFNTSTQILSCNPDGTSIRTEFEIPSDANYSIMGCCTSNNKVRYILATIETITFVSTDTIDINTKIRGDINQDNVVDISDATLLLQHSIFPDLYQINDGSEIDFTGDGNIDANDAIFLLQHALFPDLYPLNLDK